MSAPGTAPGKTNVPAKPPATLRARLEGDDFRLTVAKVLPRHLTPERFVRVASTALIRTPDLMQCDQTSFFRCLLDLSQFGLEPDGRRAHLIPRWNSKRNCMECTLVVDYKGLAELAYRSAVVSRIHADTVCENDDFEYDRGEVKRHKIDFRKPRGKIYAVYAIVDFKDGSAPKADCMSVDDVEDVRKRSGTPNKGPWVTDWAEMAKKTVFRRLSKWVPLSSEFRDAVNADEDSDRAIEIGPGGGGFELPPPAPEEGNGKTTPGDQPPQSPEDKDKDKAATQTPGAPQEPAQGQQQQQEDIRGDIPPQDELAKIVNGAGFTFSEWLEWAAAEGHIKDKELPGFDLVPDAIARRLVRAKVGMLQQLGNRKGVAA